MQTGSLDLFDLRLLAVLSYKRVGNVHGSHAGKARRTTDPRHSIGYAVAAAIALSASSAFAQPVFEQLYKFAAERQGHLQASGETLFYRRGVLYGVAPNGGDSSCENGCGLIYSLKQEGGFWKKKTLFRFKGGETGAHPRGELTPGPRGSFYGVARGEANNRDGCAKVEGCGLVYQLSRRDGSWKLTVLYRFKNNEDGMLPEAGVLLHEGELFGTTSRGGRGDRGTVFRLSPPEAAETEWAKTTLFEMTERSGSAPNGALIAGPGGKLYGVNSTGRGPGQPAGAGSVFELTPPANSKAKWALKVLHGFTVTFSSGTFISPQGALPRFVKLVRGPDGSLYGTAARGGANCTGAPSGCGVVFRLKRQGQNWAYSIIHAFQPGVFGSPGENGGIPVGGLAMDTNGNLYGITDAGGALGGGVIYKLTPPAGGGTGSWTLTVLHDIGFPSQGGTPPLLVESGGAKLFGAIAPFPDPNFAEDFGRVYRLTP
jgi:uncharacterized repeat protein (TIGR03803 family)